MRKRFFLFIPLFLLLLIGCEQHSVIVNDVGEREANEIVVFLASKGIQAVKVPAPSAGGAATEAGTALMWSISVQENKITEAMAILNQNGWPRKKEIGLLDIFSKQGLVSSEREETIRYQAGLAEQIAGTIRKIDGVLDATVQISIPQEEATLGPAPANAPQKKITAAVYVKHQGILDDPNSHLVTKIKRLVAASVSGLDINDVTVISDRARYADVSLVEGDGEPVKEKEYVQIWSIILNKSSASRFRVIFFFLILAMISFALLIGWMMWKFYPVLRKKGLKGLFNPAPIDVHESDETKQQ